MPEGITPESLMNNLVETIADGVSKKKSVSFFQEDESKKKSVSFFQEDELKTVGAQFNRLFGRQKPIYNILGGGKSADVLLWRNKKISAGVLVGATAIWVLFEWLNYNFLSFLCFGLIIGMIAQFVWSNASGLLNRSPPKVPRIVLPNELFINAAKSVGAEVNQALGFLQDVACGGNLKQFVVVVASLWAAAIVGCWCNFLTVLYVGFVAAHTLPVLYERYDDQVDGFVNSALNQFQHHYQKLDAGVLSRIPKGKLKGKKYE
ncbi:reticulon-like protein B8 isoform X1 [Rhododendron vialii]|uniref:reticulon-like protein B8 isoform X1 n=1 Tax=Rhododendron vialii TaxID=182163 RepID=UPI00265F4078|nr:reticulon-like protein B8 isoform X1 [Rhododendron vialii]XP_058195426.1 reticulon-like protein B8 isoform X1 [Rhododendron vialii]XP_058195427.1 reticulon-like protein B8 isoform X1 [Rhododendron vialii]